MKKAQRYRHPKVKLDTVVRIHTNDGIVLETTIQCIYPAGITIECDRQTALKLLPESLTTIPGVVTEAIVEIIAEHQFVRHDITASCQVIAVRRKSQDIFLIDLDFTDIAVDMEHELEQALKKHASPKLQNKKHTHDNNLTVTPLTHKPANVQNL